MYELDVNRRKRLLRHKTCYGTTFNINVGRQMLSSRTRMCITPFLSSVHQINNPSIDDTILYVYQTLHRYTSLVSN